VIILRGAMDGLSMVVPHGDPARAGLRGELVPGGLLDLGGFDGLHPTLTNLQAMYQAGELLPVNAVAGPTKVRSHFEAQAASKRSRPSEDQRLAQSRCHRVAGQLGQHPEGEAMALGVSGPLLLRGPVMVGTGHRTGLPFRRRTYTRRSRRSTNGTALPDVQWLKVCGRGFSDQA
jgi:uncharacterized protein (DUF1501 family)